MKNFRTEKRICPYSGEEFFPKRNNQRFASPKNKSDYHNSINNELKKLTSDIDRKLHRNFRILLEIMLGKEKYILSKDYLKGKGYSFEVLTHFENYEGRNCHAIYSFIIILDKNNANNVIIVRKNHD